MEMDNCKTCINDLTNIFHCNYVQNSSSKICNDCICNWRIL
jgi:hypothetical protein